MSNDFNPFEKIDPELLKELRKPFQKRKKCKHDFKMGCEQKGCLSYKNCYCYISCIHAISICKKCGEKQDSEGNKIISKESNNSSKEKEK